MALKLTCEPLAMDRELGARFAADGEDHSPPLRWAGVPARAKTLALFMDDLDAPGFVNWVAFNIPVTESGLQEGIPHRGDMTEGMLQGRNSLDRVGYTGPCPPNGKRHRYLFSLYALDDKLELEPGVSKADVERAMRGHVLEETMFIAHYARSS